MELAGEQIRAFAAGDVSACGPINGGVYAVRREILNWIEPLPSSLEQDVFPVLAREGFLYGRAYDIYFLDIGVPDDLARSRTLIPRLLSRPAALLHWKVLTDHSVASLDGLLLSPEARRAVKFLNDQTYSVILVSEGTNHIDRGALVAVRQQIQHDLRLIGAHVDDWFVPGHSDGPATVRLERRPDPYALNAARSFMVARTRIEAGTEAFCGVTTHLLADGDLLEFVSNLIAGSGSY